MRGLLWLMLCLLPLSAAAEDVLRIEITEGVTGAAPVAVVMSWQGRGEPPVAVEEIVNANLNRSGRFSPVAAGEQPQRPGTADEVDFGQWREAGVDHVVVGRYEPRSGGGYEVRFHVLDVLRGEQLAAWRIPVPGDGLRRAAHRVSDIAYEAITGQPGAFDTRLAYVSAREVDGAREYRLMVADSDGHDPRTVLASRQPIMSPAWSPDGRQLAYVSFEGRRSQVIVQNLGSGERERVSTRAGINGAPAWSPDGRRLALVLSDAGEVNIHVLDLQRRELTRITRGAAIDTEPAWSPDGRRLAFTSDRGGAPQIYEYRFDSGQTRRLTFEGGYNARPRFTVDGRSLVVVHGHRGRFMIGAVDLDSGSLRLLSEGPLDESPDLAPNGAMVIYAARRGDRGELATVSFDGRVRQRLSAAEGDVREPAWSPPRSRNSPNTAGE